MKQLYKILFITILVSLTWSASGKNVEGPRTRIERTITREFTTASEPKIRLATQKGQIKFRTWNENKILIRITIVSEADTKHQAENGLDLVHIITKQTGDIMHIETDFENQDSGNTFWNLIRFWEDDLKLTVDMIINVPANSTYDLTHRYGDLILPNIRSAKVDIQYGSMNSGHIRENFDLVARYSHGTLGDLAHGKILLQYSDFEFGDIGLGTVNTDYSKFHSHNADKISMDSKYSSITIEKVEELKFNGKFDKIEVEDADIVKILTKYTAINIGTLRSFAEITNSYQSTKIQYILPGFQKLQISGKYGNLTLGFDGIPDADFDLQTKYGKIQVPDGATIRASDDSTSTRYMKGCLGACRQPLFVRNSYGNITLESH